jgi:hypothetical protein
LKGEKVKIQCITTRLIFGRRSEINSNGKDIIAFKKIAIFEG